MISIQAYNHPIWLILHASIFASITAVVIESNNATVNSSSSTSKPGIAEFSDAAEELKINPNSSSGDMMLKTPKVVELQEEEVTKNKTASVPPTNSTDDVSFNETSFKDNQDKIDSYQKRTAHILASKFMGSLFVAYILICVLLAIKHGPMFTS